MKIGVLGTGGIVAAVAPTIKKLEETECYAIASRTLERAEEAAAEYGFKKAYGSYEELVNDPEVELVYIATPHSRHFEDMKLCIEHGKHVLCEKAFTLNAAQTREIRHLAAEAGVYVAEAIWTRYMPSRKMIQEVLDSGIIGNVRTLTANLSYKINQNRRCIEPELAGGALLDIGIFGLNFTVMHFGTEIEKIESSVQFTDTGVDGMESLTVFYKDGRMAVLTHSMFGRSDRKGIFYGEKGYIVVENINNPQSITVFDSEDRVIKRVEIPEQISGYEYEFIEAVKCIKNGKIESDSMPFDDSIFMMEIMDGIRRDWGFVYPQER